MKIGIIKLGALGDVIRTTPILEVIKKKYPESEVTWITKSASKEILTGNKNIDKILTLPLNLEMEFDILYSLDIELEATQLASKISAKTKYGYYDTEGFPTSFNIGAEYYLNTVFDDELKKSNRKTYQEMIFEVCELPYNKEEPYLSIPEESTNNINNFLQENNLEGKKIIGFNIGSSPRWPSKAWHKNKIIEFIKRVREEYEVILLGGPEELESMNVIFENLKSKGIKVYPKNTSNSIKDFFALINVCNKIISADSLAMQASIALKKQTIVLFFCTAPWEIESYGRVKKIISPKFENFFPERMDEYDEELINSISVESVLQEINQQ